MRRVLFFCLLAVVLAVPCRGEEATAAVPGLDQVWDRAEDYGVRAEDGLDGGLRKLLSQGLELLGPLLRSGSSTALKLLAVVLLCGLAEGARPQEDGGLSAATIAGALAITALTMTDMAAMIGLGWDTIGSMEEFSGLLLPVMALLTAATGSVTAAVVRQGATVMFSQLLIAAMDRLLIPLVYAYVAVSCAHAAVGNDGLKKLAGLLKGVATFILTGMLMAFVGYLAASGAIAGSVDAAAIKAAKLAITRVVPVVGGILADASESVLAGAGVLRGTVGAAGLVVVLAICLVPFLRLGVQYLVYKLTAALCATLAQPRLSQLIDAIGVAFGLVLGMTGACALVLLVGLVSAVAAVAP